jgi:SAM-dependent methyltransferase
VPDALFADPRLAPLYDLFDDDRCDLDAYLAIVDELGVRRVLDVGCGTGSFAVLLAVRGVEVVAVDPAEASLDVARQKAAADLVRWQHGDAKALPELEVDLVTLTGNVAQAIFDPAAWRDTLAVVRGTLRQGGYLVFETRDPARRAWEEWTPENTRRALELPDGTNVERWHEVKAVPPVARHLHDDVRLLEWRRLDVRVDAALPRTRGDRGRSRCARIRAGRGA